MSPTPFFVSVIIPAHNCEAYLADAVESVHRQAHPRLEVIIVDDGSTDRTAEIAQRLTGNTLRYVYEQNGGPARARNHGVALANGDVIGFLDADDLWPVDKLGRQLRYLETDSSIDVVLGRTRCIRQVAGADAAPATEDSSPTFVLLTPTAALFRRRVFERVGGFDEGLRYGEDTDWFMRAREGRVPMVVHDDVTLLYRRHTQNMTRGRDVKELRVLDVLKRSLDRRRQQHHGVADSLPNLFDLPPRSQ